MFKKVDVHKIKLIANISFWLFLIVFLTVFVKYIKIYTCDSPRFILNDIKIRIDGGKTITGDEAFSYLNLKKGESIFKINPARLSRKISTEHPEILKIHIYKKMPVSLDVDIKNRIPAAQIHLGRFYPLDGDGFILPFPSNFRIKSLACIEGLNLTEVRIGKENSTLKIFSGLKILNLLADIIKDDYNRVDVDVSDPQNTMLLLPEGIKVKLGKEGFKEKLVRLKLVLADIKNKSLNPAVIDLRFEKAILVPR